MKKKILFTTSKGLSSKFVFHTICDTFEELYDRYKDDYEIVFLTRYSDAKKVRSLLKRRNRKEFFDDIALFNDYTKDLDYTKANNWEDIIEELDCSDFKDYAKIIEFGSALSEGAYMQVDMFRYDKVFQTTAQFKYLSVRALKEIFLFLYKTSYEYNIPIEHYILDPQEMRYDNMPIQTSYTRYFPYNSKKHDFVKDDYFLDFYKKNKTIKEKTIDFTFGYTILTKDRAAQDFSRLDDWLSDYKTILLKKDKYNDIDTFVEKDVYLSYIKDSKFTLIIPSYDVSTFSAYRYIESIYNGCIPLILDSTDISEAKDSLYIPEYLITSLEGISDTMKNLNYDEVIKDLMENM